MSTLHLILFFVGMPFVYAALAAILFRARRHVEVDPGQAASVSGKGAGINAERLDLPVLLRAVADSLEPLARSHHTRISLAVSPGRTVHASGEALRSALRATIETAIRAATGGRVLISVLPLGTQLHILVTDDGAHSVRATRESMAREAASAIALQGGSLAVEARRGHGTTVTLRLPMLTASEVKDHVEFPVPVEETATAA
ncbi:MAG: HAMP domain-containing histidine kinase [Acetobacteraceae bacterium]|nr:HAMP domain-containing histidine kinase [Acetobacteraceae bacterium]